MYEKGPVPDEALTVLTYVPDGIVTPAGFDVRENEVELLTADKAFELTVIVADVEFVIATLDIVVFEANTAEEAILIPGTNARISPETATLGEPFVVVIFALVSIELVIADVNNEPTVNKGLNKSFLLPRTVIVDVDDCRVLL